MSSHFGELRQLLLRAPWSQNHHTRAQQLLAALSRGPWDAWGEILGNLQLPADFSGIVHHDAQMWVAWADSFWEEVYVQILEQARHGLSLWKLRMKDSANGAGLKEVSRWLKGQGGVPVLRNDDGTFTAHPHSVGATLAEKWGGFLGVEPPSFDPQTLSDMTQDIRDRPWTLPELTAEDFWTRCRSVRASAMGEDRIPILLLKKLPLSAWGMVAALFRGVESGKAWPKGLCTTLSARSPVLTSLDPSQR